MKVSDAIAKWLAERGCRHVFLVSGGANLHVIDSLARRKESHGDITLICTQNEQAASFAADSYARLTGFGCACATSGPGATNLLTGIAASYYDSIPVLYLTGNQTRSRLGVRALGNDIEFLPLRQFGFQATPIVEIARTITKYAVTVTEETKVIEELWKAHIKAREGRPGPVLIDIPDDVARGEL